MTRPSYVNEWAAKAGGLEAGREARAGVFKLLACPSHAWPAVGCEACLDRLCDEIERLWVGAPSD